MTEPSNAAQLAETIFRHAVAAVQPAPLIRKNVRLEGNRLTISQTTLTLTDIDRIFVVGAGKATGPMAQALETILGNWITDGIIIVKEGHAVPLSRIRTVEAAHPVPDDNGIAGTEQLRQLVGKAGKRDLVICLLSGGGSALLIDTLPGCTLPELQRVFRLLLDSGADITEINTVRKHLSAVKGGGLARAAHPARLVTLVLSDVIGDPLDVIASGPTVPDPTTFKETLAVIEKYNLVGKMPAPVLTHLQKGSRGELTDTPKADDPVFDKTTTSLIGSNAIALKAAKEKAEQLGFHTQILTDRLTGEAREVAVSIVTEAKRVFQDSLSTKPVCLLWGGETTVTIQGNGLGGRNQELALAAAIDLQDQERITVLAGGTDGTDGPTDATGAVVNGFTVAQAAAKGVQAELFLDNNDSYHFFAQAGGHLMTGPTLTNVMDIIVALIY